MYVISPVGEHSIKLDLTLQSEMEEELSNMEKMGKGWYETLRACYVLNKRDATMSITEDLEPVVLF